MRDYSVAVNCLSLFCILILVYILDSTTNMTSEKNGNGAFFEISSSPASLSFATVLSKGMSPLVLL